MSPSSPESPKIATSARHTAGLTLALVAGCSFLPSSPPSGADPAAELELLPAISDGTYRVQAVVKTYKAQDVDHLVVKLFKVAGGSEVAVTATGDVPLSKDIASGSLDTPVRFKGLRPDTTYRIRAYAYKAAGTSAADQISEDASSTVDVATGRDDRPALTSLPVQLLGATFSAEATTSSLVMEGVLVGSGSPTFSVTPP